MLRDGAAGPLTCDPILYTRCVRSWPLQLVSVTLVLLLTGSPLAAVVCDAVCAGAAADVASDASGAAPAHDHAQAGDTPAHAGHSTAAHDDHTVVVDPATNTGADAARIGSDPRPCESHLAAPLPVTAARYTATLRPPSTAAAGTVLVCAAARAALLPQTHASPPPDVAFLRAPVALRI